MSATIKKKQLVLYTDSILRNVFAYCVEKKWLAFDAIYDDFTRDYKKFLDYCKSNYLDKMTFEEFKKG